MKIKLISENMTDFYSNKLKFAVGEITECPDYLDNDEIGNGIHYSHSLTVMLENTKHNGRGHLIEIEPVGKETPLGNKFKAPAVKTVKILTITEWLETLSSDDADGWNRRLRAAKVGDWNNIFQCIV